MPLYNTSSKINDDLALTDVKASVNHLETTLEGTHEGPLAAALSEVEALSPEQFAIEQKKLVRKASFFYSAIEAS